MSLAGDPAHERFRRWWPASSSSLPRRVTPRRPPLPHPGRSDRGGSVAAWDFAPDHAWLRVETAAGAALVLGWTSNTVRVQSDPRLSKSHQYPDVKVGPGADDFVDAVVAQEWFPDEAPVATRLGGASGWYFTLRGPADLSECYEWRPWDRGFYAQGPSNVWEVWVLDADGHRVLIVANYFPGTPAGRVNELRRMVDSLRFATR